MFRWVLVLVMLVACQRVGRCDVVLQNTTTGTGITSSPNTGTFNIKFNAPVDANLAGIVLYNSSSTLSTFSSLEWQLERAGHIVGSKSFTAATLANGNTIAGNGGSTRNGYFFDFSNSTLANPLQSGLYNLYAVNLNSSVTGWSFADGSSISVNSGSGFSSATYEVANDPRYNFQLSTAAVPEPGTLVMGGIGLLAGALVLCVRRFHGLGA